MSNINEKKRKTPGLKSHIATQKTAPAHTTLAKARSVDVVQFVESRSFEINALQKSLDDARSSGNLRAFQTLPRHLRRRAASHNVKRIPARLREKAIAEMTKSAQNSKTLSGGAGGKLTNAKRSSRYKRRRARTVREEYELRQTGKRWLETHVWHAKRMGMKEIWGTMVATTPNERSHRAAYRTAMEKTYIQDVSYFGTMELKGTERSIIDAVKSIVAPDTGGICLTRQPYLSGGRMASLTMYKAGQYPRGMLGPAMALWKPKLDEDHGSDRTLWLRIHPAMSAAVLAELGSAKSAAVQVADISSELVSFELLGSQSTRALAAVLSHSVSPSTTGSGILQHIKELPSPEVLPEGVVLALHIHDPRLRFPFKLPPAGTILAEQRLQQLNDLLMSWPKDAASFGNGDGVWDREQCAKATESRPSEHALNQRRNEQLVPGTKLDPIPGTDVAVPVLLVRTGPECMVGSRVTSAINNQVVGNLAHGWTVIAPRGWGMPLWMALQFVGARAQGLDERTHVGFEAGLPTFPGSWPGTDAFDEWVGAVATDEYDRWSHRPPGKRANYLRFGIDTPFFPDFYKLLGIQGSLPEAYPAVAADDLECRVKRLRKIKANRKNSGSAMMDVDTTSVSSGQIWLASGERAARAIKAMLSLAPPMSFVQWSKPLLEAALILPHDISDSDCQGLLDHCLVRVRLICRGRGTPAKNAPICCIGKQQSSTIGYVMTGSFSLARGCGMAVGACSLRGLFGLWKERQDLESKKCPDVCVKALNGEPCFEAVLTPLP